MKASMQINRFLEALAGKPQPRIPVLPVQMDVIRPLLQRVAAAEAAERTRARQRRKSHPLRDFLTRAYAAVSQADGRGNGRMQALAAHGKARGR